MQIFLNGSIDGALRGTTTPSQSGLGSNGNEEYSTLIKSSELKPHHQIQLNAILRPPTLRGVEGVSASPGGTVSV